MKEWTYVCCLIVCLVAPVQGAENEPPPNLVLKYGTLAKPIWKSYHQEGRLDLDLFIRDHLKLGSIHDGDCEMFLAWSLMQIKEDPKPVLEELLKSNEAREVGFALYTIGWLHDRRFYDQVVALTESEMLLPSWNYTSVSSMAESFRDSLKAERVIDLRELDGIERKIHLYRAQWHKDLVPSETGGEGEAAQR